MGVDSKKKNIIHCCVERDIYDMLIRHCERTGQAKTVAIKRAIAAYCADNGVTVGGSNQRNVEGGRKDG